jgi:hypothetical protein
MINQKRIQLTKLALALSIALSAAPTFAQNTTSAIGGRISGADGKAASGATVSIIHTESGSVSNVTTDAEGRYVARGLRVGGPYTIIITKNGVSEKREGIFTNLAETAAVDATIGASMQSVTVTGSASRSEKFSKTTMGAVTTIGPTELATQASIQRSLQDYARADPRVSQTDKERGEVSVAGQNFRSNSMTIDGVSVNDTFGLESNGTPTVRQPISIEAIQSVQVNVANYDATQKGYTGANINASTKSGTNKWKGSLYYVFRDDKLAGDRYNVTTDSYYAPQKFEETTKGAWVSGPLIKDKLFMFLLMEETRSTRNAAAFGPIGSEFTNVGITQDSINAVRDIAKTKWGMDVGTVEAVNELVLREQMLKLDWNISDDHRASIRYGKTTQSEPFFGGSSGFNATNLTLSSSIYDQQKSIETVVAQVFSDWTPSFSTEFKASKRIYDAVPKNNARLPSMTVQFAGPVPTGVQTGTRSLNFGTESNRHLNVLGTTTIDLYGGANYQLGDHDIKFGGDYTKNTIYNAFVANYNGNYTFSCINSSATLTYSFGAINCGTATAAQNAAASLENFRLGRTNSFTLQVAAPGHTVDEAFANFSMKNTGLFVQDTWSVTPALTVTFGVRVDSSSVGSKPLANVAAAAPVVAGDPATNKRQTGGFGLDNTFTIDGQELVQPRFGFNYKFPSTRNMQLRGGAGLFQGAAATVWMSNPFSNHGVATRTITCSTSTTRCPVTPIFSANPDTQPRNVGATPAVAIDFLDSSLRQPSIYKANLAFDTELPWYGLVFGAEFLYNKNKESIYYEHLNLGPATKVGKDGRNLYYNANGLSASCYSANNGTITTVTGCTNTAKALSNISYGNVLVAKSTDQGRGYVGTVSLSRPLTKGYGWSLAYSYTDSTDVSALSSSIANSVFTGRAAFQSNENVASNSSYLVKDRVNALINFQKKLFGTYNTRFGMFYEGRSGRPYSWTMNNDMNGDGVQGNDLMYIPTAFGSGDVVFYGDTAGNTANERRFWDIVDANKTLKEAAGGVVKRNSAFAPWTNSFDLRISQEIPGLFAGNKGTLSLDFMNFGNLINKKWGRINEIQFQNGGNARNFVDYVGLDASGRYVYAVRPQLEEPEIRQAKGESQWAIQASVKYEF